MRTMLNMILGSTTEVQTALRELDELGSGGWRPASEALGLRTQWRPDDDGSLWVRIDGELSGASLLHASAVAHEAELWPKWMPFCGAAEVLTQISSYERTTYVQFDLTPMMKRGALIHWSISDSLQERQSILLLGASLGDAAPVEVPASAEGIKLASFKCIMVLIYPLTKTSCRVRWVSHVDLKAGSLPQTLVSMVTNKVAGSLLSTLMREAQKATQAQADANAIYVGGAGSTPDVRRISSGAAPTADNVYLRRIQDDPSFYRWPPSSTTTLRCLAREAARTTRQRLASDAVRRRAETVALGSVRPGRLALTLNRIRREASLMGSRVIIVSRFARS